MPAGAVTREAIDELLPTLQGWCTEAKARVIADLVVDQDMRCCVEIGVFGGRSLFAMALALRELGGERVAWGIDPWSAAAALEGTNDPENDAWWAALDYREVYRGFVRAAVDADLLAHCAWLRLPAESAVALFADGTVDLLHIDGNHSQWTSVRDVVLWLPKVRPGGFVVMDDVNWLSTRMAQQLVEERSTLVAHHDSYALYRVHG